MVSPTTKKVAIVSASIIAVICICVGSYTLIKPSGAPAELTSNTSGNVNTAVNVEPAQSGLINEVINSENSKVNDKKADKKKEKETKKQKSDSESDSDSSESDPETSKSNTNTSTLPSEVPRVIDSENDETETKTNDSEAETKVNEDAEPESDAENSQANASGNNAATNASNVVPAPVPTSATSEQVEPENGESDSNDYDILTAAFSRMLTHIVEESRSNGVEPAVDSNATGNNIETNEVPVEIPDESNEESKVDFAVESNSAVNPPFEAPLPGSGDELNNNEIPAIAVSEAETGANDNVAELGGEETKIDETENGPVNRIAVSVESADRVEPSESAPEPIADGARFIAPATEIVLTVNETRGVFGAANEAINTAVATSVVGGSNVNAFEPEFLVLTIHSQSEEQPMDVTEEESNLTNTFYVEVPFVVTSDAFDESAQIESANVSEVKNESNEVSSDAALAGEAKNGDSIPSDTENELVAETKNNETTVVDSIPLGTEGEFNADAKANETTVVDSIPSDARNASEEVPVIEIAESEGKSEVTTNTVAELEVKVNENVEEPGNSAAQTAEQSEVANKQSTASPKQGNNLKPRKYSKFLQIKFNERQRKREEKAKANAKAESKETKTEA